MRNRRHACWLAGWLLVLGATGMAHADRPVSPITFVMSFPEGSALDKVAQLMRPALERKLRTPITFDYQMGSDASRALSYVAKSRPDGYTILLAPVPAPGLDGTSSKAAAAGGTQSVALLLDEASGRRTGTGAPEGDHAISLGLFAPQGVDRHVAEKFALAARDVLELPAVRAQLASLGPLVPNTPVEPSRAAVVQGGSQPAEGEHALAVANPSPIVAVAKLPAPTRPSLRRHSTQGTSARAPLAGSSRSPN